MADNNVFVTSQSKGGNIKGKRNSQGTDQKILVFPSKLGEFSSTEPVAYMMIQIYDRKSARKLKGDKDFSVSVQQDGTATTTLVGTKQTASSVNQSREKNALVYDKISELQKIKGDVDLKNVIIDKDVISLDRVIAIPMPNQIQHSLDATINAQSTGALSAAAEDLGGAAQRAAQTILPDILKSEVLAGFGKGKRPSQQIAVGALNAAKGQGEAAINDLIRNQGLVVNDRREMWFEGMEFRNFSFTYTFSPRNLAEAETLQNIIETLRFYMLPTYDSPSDLGGGKFYMIQPAEFEMKFMIGDVENKAIPKIDRCLLKSCTVDYSPRNKWIMLSDGSGFPPEISLELRFIEKQLMFREKVFNENNNELFGGF